MKHTAKGFALANGLSIHQVFSRAWRDTYGRTSNLATVAEDADRYMNYGAVPPYVQQFLSKQELRRILILPYYAVM